MAIILTMGSKALQDEIIDRKTKVLQKLATPVVKKYTPLKHYILEATPGAFSARRQLLSPRFFQDAFNEFNRLTMKRAYTIPENNFDFLPDKCLKNDPISTYRAVRQDCNCNDILFKNHKVTANNASQAFVRLCAILYVLANSRSIN